MENDPAGITTISGLTLHYRTPSSDWKWRSCSGVSVWAEIATMKVQARNNSAETSNTGRMITVSANLSRRAYQVPDICEPVNAAGNRQVGTPALN